MMPSPEEWDKAISPLLRHSNRWRTGKVNEIMCLLASNIRAITDHMGSMRQPVEPASDDHAALLVLSTYRVLEALSEQLVNLFSRLQEVQAGLYAVEQSDAQDEPSPSERLHQEICVWRSSWDAGVQGH